MIIKSCLSDAYFYLFFHCLCNQWLFHKKLLMTTIMFHCLIYLLLLLVFNWAGIARTQSPIRKNYAIESSAFGTIAGVSQTGVQWKGLTLEEPPF